MGAERERVEEFGKLENGLRQAGDWYRWGPYVSERQWGTVREDYSADGDAWNYLPHDQARSRAYRWGEDGLAGFCDVEQRLCLGLALWNGRDPILKERAFGLTGAQGNHGEDVKEYWWYLDAIPSHAWNRWRYHYPQGPFPYQDLIDVNGSRSRLEPEYELLDTGVFDGNRYWIVEVHYAKASPDDLLMTISVTNAGPDTATLHVLPTAWFRNTWSWGDDPARPVLGAAASDPSVVSIEHPFVGELELIAGPGPDGTGPTVLFCENETNLARLYGAAPLTPYPKDGINDHVVGGAPTVNPGRTGTKCAFWYRVALAGGASAELRLRLRPASSGGAAARGLWAAAVPTSGAAAAALGAEFDQVMTRRRAEADEFYAELTPREASDDEALVMRQAFAGMLWSKQLFYYDVARWLDGDPGQPDAAARAADRAQLALAQLRRVRHHVDAGQVGVPLVRRVGPGFPLRGAGPRGPGVRQVPADPAVPGVVPASRAGRCPRTSGTSPTSTRRCRPGRRWRCSPSTRAATWSSCPGCSTSCWSTSPGGSTWRTRAGRTSTRAASSAWTTSARSTGPSCPWAGSWSSPTPPGGWASTRSRWAGSPPCWPRAGSGRRPTWCSSSWSTSPPSATRWTARGCGMTTTGSTTTGW